jgi:hypothetical protein
LNKSAKTNGEIEENSRLRYWAPDGVVREKAIKVLPTCEFHAFTKSSARAAGLAVWAELLNAKADGEKPWR